MPKVKKTKAYSKNYSEEQLQRALEAIKSGISKKAAATRFNIPRATLQFRLSSKFSKPELGRNTYLTKDEETALVEWILDSHRKGFPIRKMDLQLSVKGFLDACNRSTPFKDNLPGDRWYKLFMKRHPIITERIPEGVTPASANVSEKDIKGWFLEIQNYLHEKEYFSILMDPTRIYNADETCFQFCPKLGKILAPIGTKNAYEVDRGNAKQNLTVLFTFSASGETTPPFIVYPNKRLPKSVVNNIPENWGIGLSEKGWMNAHLFLEYIKTILHPHLKLQNIQFPVILFVDGHKSHLTYQVSQRCTELSIILICLYPNSTRILQPADVSCFRPLKLYWQKAVVQWRKKNPYGKLGKEHFASILKEAILQLKSQTIVNGFQACGLYPWNCNAIDFSKCLGKQRVTIIPEEKNENSFDMTLENPYLNFENFRTIVSTELIRKLRNNSSPNSSDLTCCESFDCLKKIYDFFKIEDNENTTADLQFEPHIENEDSFFSQEELENMPVLVLGNRDTDHSTRIIGECESSNQNIQVHENITLYSNNLDKSDELWNKEKTLVANTDEMEVENSVVCNFVIAKGEMVIDHTENNKEVNQNIENRFARLDSPELQQFLPYTKTPERTGQRQTKRMPFVLTSTQYKKIIEEKEKNKEEKDKKKEENKQKKLLKANNINNNKSKPNANKKLSLQIGKQEKEKKKNQEKLIKLRNNNQKETTKNVKPNSPISENPFVQSNPITYVSNENLLSSNKESHVRNLFKDSLAIMPKNNVVIQKGLCFCCTNNIYLSKIGIKCQKCNRTYHTECLKKNKLYREYFVCKSCLK